MKLSSWLIWFLSTILTILTLVSAFNYWFYPYEVDLNRITMHNLVYDRNLERMLKHELYDRNKNKYDQIIFGTSRATVMDASLISDNTFNFSFANARLWEFSYATKNILDLSTVKKVYLGLDEHMFDSSHLVWDDVESYFDHLDMFYEPYLYFSVDTIKDIYKTWKEPPLYQYEINGTKHRLNVAPLELEKIDGFISKVNAEINQGYHRFNQTRARNLAIILKVLKQNNVKVVLFINPITHELRQFYQEHNPDYPLHLQYIQSFNLPYVDFNYDNAVTRDYKTYFKDSHHIKAIGTRLMAQCLLDENKCDGFGKWVYPQQNGRVE